MSDLKPDHERLQEYEREERIRQAAPDMLEALLGIHRYAEEQIHDICADMQEGGSGQGMDKWNDVCAAIAKAKGEE